MEKEEELREESGMYAIPKIEYDETMIEIQRLAKKIRDKKIIMREERRLIKSSTKPKMPRTATNKAEKRTVTTLTNELRELGVDVPNNVDDKHYSAVAKRVHFQVVPNKEDEKKPKKPNRNELGIRDPVVSIIFKVLS